MPVAEKPSDQEDERLTVAEAAAFLRLVPNTLNIWRMTGRYNLPYVRVGRRVFYLKSDLIAWLDSRRVV